MTSLPNAVDGQYVTLIASEGSLFEMVTAVTDPSGGATPVSAEFPVGHFEFVVTANPSAEVTMLLPDGVEVDDSVGPRRVVSCP